MVFDSTTRVTGVALQPANGMENGVLSPIK